MGKQVWTYELAHAAAWDAGNQSMQRAGRERRNEEDWNAMCDTFNRLFPMGKDDS
jgi:hypothetical protein